MNKPRVLLNGFGRIGRAIFRVNLQRQLFDLVAINVINPDNKNIEYLTKYDSTYGRLTNEVASDDRNLYIDGCPIRVTHESEIKNLNFTGIDVVIEATGVQKNNEQIEALAAGEFGGKANSVRRFIITNISCKSAVNVIFGVNEELLDDKSIRIVSSSICDTISCAPIYNILQKNFTIESGFLTTLHPWLSYQNLLDGPAKSWSNPGDVFSHYALGRAAPQTLIPKSTSAIRGLDFVFPGALQKISSFSYRTPTPVVSSAVLTLKLTENTDTDTLVSLFKDFESKQTHHVIRTTDEPLVSTDYAGDDYSAIIDTRWIQVNNGNHIELVYWYDNEWGYSTRVAEVASLS